MYRWKKIDVFKLMFDLLMNWNVIFIEMFGLLRYSLVCSFVYLYRNKI